MQPMLDAARERLERHARLLARLVPYNVLRQQQDAQQVREIEARLDALFPAGFVEAPIGTIDDGSAYGDPTLDQRPEWLRAIDMMK